MSNLLDQRDISTQNETVPAYMVIRFFSDGRRAKRIRYNQTREQAVLWCGNPSTRGMLRSGVKWFNGFRAYANRRIAVAV